jgi:hypothetical protein
MSILEEVQEMGVLEKSPKWSSYGVSLSMALMRRHFKELYTNP